MTSSWTEPRPHGTLLLAKRDVFGLLDLDTCIAAVADAFRLHAQGRTLPPGVLGVPSVAVSLTPWPPRSWGIHSAEAPSAGAPFASAWCRQPNTTSGSMCPITCRIATAQGRGAFRIDPSGALTVIGASEPALLGTAGATRHLTPNDVYAVV